MVALGLWSYAAGIERHLYRQSADPDLVYELRPHAEFGRYRLNSRGFRDEERPLTKNPTTFRIVSLGDSVAFGLGAEAGETYSRVLERLLNERPLAGRGILRYEVVNLAVLGYNSAQERRVLERTGLAYSPDLVLVGFVFNDYAPPPRYDARGLLVTPDTVHVWYIGLLRRSQLLTILTRSV